MVYCREEDYILKDEDGLDEGFDKSAQLLDIIERDLIAVDAQRTLCEISEETYVALKDYMEKYQTILESDY